MTTTTDPTDPAKGPPGTIETIVSWDLHRTLPEIKLREDDDDFIACLTRLEIRHFLTTVMVQVWLAQSTDQTVLCERLEKNVHGASFWSRYPLEEDIGPTDNCPDQEIRWTIGNISAFEMADAAAIAGQVITALGLDFPVLAAAKVSVSSRTWHREDASGAKWMNLDQIFLVHFFRTASHQVYN